jgi:hypothetical protein
MTLPGPVARGLARALLATIAVVTVGLGLSVATPASAQSYAACNGVWVVVDFGRLGGVQTHCAKSFGTGLVALRSAGFAPTSDGGMVTKIAGKPSKPDTGKEYWSYWHATRKSDGTYSGWSYSSLGADSYHPTKGAAEGWRYQSLSDGKVSPAAAPPKNAVASAPSTIPKPTLTATATAKATRKATSSASAKATSSSPHPSASSSTVTPTPTPSLPASSEAEATDSAPPSLAATSEPSQGSPTATVTAGVVLVAAVGSLGSWWIVRGRRH